MANQNKRERREPTAEETQIRSWLARLPQESPLPFIPNDFRKILQKLKGPNLSVLIAYASHADEEGTAFPSIETLCEETGYGVCAVKLARTSLVLSGLLVFVRQERKPDGTMGRCIFRLGWFATAV